MYRFEILAKIPKEHFNDDKPKYDYSLTPCKFNQKDKVDIKCLKCNKIFKQRMDNHLTGQGCPICNKQK